MYATDLKFQVLQINFTKFHIEVNSGSSTEDVCRYDNVTVFDGPVAIDNSMGTYCGELDGTEGRLPKREMETSGNVASIRFLADSSEGREGFTLKWKAVDRTRKSVRCSSFASLAKAASRMFACCVTLQG